MKVILTLLLIPFFSRASLGETLVVSKHQLTGNVDFFLWYSSSIHPDAQQICGNKTNYHHYSGSYVFGNSCLQELAQKSL